jgi:hypothetical protein
MMTKSTEKLVRNTLGILLLLVAINAFGGGYYGMAGAKNVPTEWLKKSPFHNYFVPGLILFVVVGGLSLVAAIAVFKQHRFAHKLAFFCGVIILIWLSIQIAIIGYVSWMQPTTGIAALLILILTWLLSKNRSDLR